MISAKTFAQEVAPASTSTAVNASETATVKIPADSQKQKSKANPLETKTLFNFKPGNGLKSIGFSAAPVSQFGTLGFQQGFNLSLHLNKQWAFGGTVLSNFRGNDRNGMGVSDRPRQSFAGFQVEFTPKPQALIYVSFPLIIGVIRIQDPNMYMNMDPQTNLPVNGQPYYQGQGGMMYHDDRDRDRDREDNFGFGNGPSAFGIQPGINLEVNVFKYGKLFGGVNYRFAAGKNSTADMKGISGQIGMKLGIFDKSISELKNSKKKKN